VAATLKTLIYQTADYVKADLDDDDDRDILESRIISGLNEAKNEIARKHYPLYFTEDIVLDNNGAFSVTDTTRTLYAVESVSQGGVAIPFEQRASMVMCGAGGGTTVTVKYRYIPADMVNENDAYVFPDVVDYRILCYRAAQTFYEIKGTASSLSKAAVWRSKWNEALRNKLTANDPTVIRDVYYTKSGW
jgi:hypothetical protein